MPLSNNCPFRRILTCGYFICYTMATMKDKNFFLANALLFSILSLFVGLYILSLRPEAALSLTKAIFFYALLVIVSLFWTIAIAYKKISSDAFSKYDNLETLLLDIRDGTRYFYREKRKTFRVATDIIARFANKISGDEFIKIGDISYEGALLKTTHEVKVGDILELNIYLPLFSQPIYVKANVMRVKLTKETKGGSAIFEVGVEYADMFGPDREKLIETVNILHKSGRKKR